MTNRAEIRSVKRSYKSREPKTKATQKHAKRRRVKTNLICVLKMKILVIFALLASSQAVELAKPEQQLPEMIELPAHIQTLITNHINQVLKHKPTGHTTTITGHVPQLGNGKAVDQTVAVPHLDLLPPHIAQSQPKVPQVINHKSTVTWQNKAPGSASVAVPHIVISVPGQAPLNIGDKVNKLQKYVSYVMQQAELQIPQAINQAIKEREKQQAQKQQQGKSSSTTSSSISSSSSSGTISSTTSSTISGSTTGTTSSTISSTRSKPRLLLDDNEVPELSDDQVELQKQGKCSFKCPKQSLPVCATNGDCIVEFPGLCELSKWNCFNANNVFRQAHDDECQKTIKCYNRDNM